MDIGERTPARGLPVRHPLMHRTRTVDYGVVLSGEIDMMLDELGDAREGRGCHHPSSHQSRVDQSRHAGLPHIVCADRFAATVTKNWFAPPAVLLVSNLPNDFPSPRFHCVTGDYEDTVRSSAIGRATRVTTTRSTTLPVIISVQSVRLRRTIPARKEPLSSPTSFVAKSAIIPGSIKCIGTERLHPGYARYEGEAVPTLAKTHYRATGRRVGMLHMRLRSSRVCRFVAL